MTQLRIPTRWSVAGMEAPSWMVSFSTIAVETGQPVHLGTALVLADSPEEAYLRTQDLGIAPISPDPEDDPENRHEVMVLGPVDSAVNPPPPGQPFDVLLSVEEMEDADLEPVSVVTDPSDEGW